jgi:hypothetical protein
MLFAYPRQAAVDRVIPKTKLYEHGDANTGLRGLFVDQVHRVVWTHALNPTSTNLPAAGGCEEIDIIRIETRIVNPEALDQRILRCIDRAIPRATVLEVHTDGGIQVLAQIKGPATARQHKATSQTGTQPAKPVTTSIHKVPVAYLSGPVLPVDQIRQALPVVTTLRGLFESLLEPLLGLERGQQESLPEVACRRQEVTRLDKRIGTLRKRMNAERQFNRRVALNAELRDLEQQRLVMLAEPA